MKTIIRLLGLKGSFKWAVRQLKKGETLTFKSVTGTLRFKLDSKENERLVSTFDSKSNYTQHNGKYIWDSAVFHLSMIKKTDWCLLKENKRLFNKLFN